MEEKSKLLEDALHEVNKPLARYKDDEDLDQMLREMDRAEDPMLAFIKKKKKNAAPVKGGYFLFNSLQNYKILDLSKLKVERTKIKHNSRN